MSRAATVVAALALWPVVGASQVLNHRALFERQDWWDNRDFSWLAARIPAFESPEPAIEATYYYRWELVTKHLTYGSSTSGYTFTEFIDRPFWSGAYGAISCPLGHQMEEIRWLDDPRVIEDFARYWFETPGAEPRSYSNWYGAAVWDTFLVRGDTGFLRRLLPYMKRQYAGWMAERWDSSHRMFRWDGLHDGMERNINSRQTDDIDTGAEGYRPTLNTYLFADAGAIAEAAALFGDSTTARDYAARAAQLRQRVEQELWDERREFFLHQSARNEKDGVLALTRTYQNGRYAGNAAGRELIGYVPWQFNLPQPGKGYERAWRFLMDTAYFAARFGPLTTERHDPLFYVSPECCWWSGNSWPYATTQTLVAMANLLNHYSQQVVSSRDWMNLFRTYTLTQRKDGRPYIAEAANPDNGSWAGHDTPYHSEHYFHSGYVNLLITGLIGLRPRADDSVEVNPLAPPEWDWFGLDRVRYHGRTLTVLWDRDGSRYHRGSGLILLADGREIGRRADPGRLVVRLGPLPRAIAPVRDVNFAVNNGGSAYPWVEASYASPEHPPTYLVDGNYWYHAQPPNRWTTTGSPNPRDTVLLDFGTPRRIDRLALYFLDDGPAGPVRAPLDYEVQLWQDNRWAGTVSEARDPVRPEGRRANQVRFAPISTERVRVVLTPQPGRALGLSELEAWGPGGKPLAGPTRAPRDLAFNPGNRGYPRAAASFTGLTDRVDQVNDLRVGFTRYSRNRWTAYRSPNPRDWVAIDFGRLRVVRSLELYFYGDGREIAAPRNYTIEIWDGAGWRPARERSRLPASPQASARNLVLLDPVRTDRVRVWLEHAPPAWSGITELIVR